MYEIVDKIDEQNVPLVLDGFINYKPQSAFLVSWNCHKISLLPPSSKQDNRHKREECPSFLRSFWAFRCLQDLDFSCVACFGSCQCSQIFICLWSWYYFCALFVFIVILDKKKLDWSDTSYSNLDETGSSHFTHIEFNSILTIYFHAIKSSMKYLSENNRWATGVARKFDWIYYTIWVLYFNSWVQQHLIEAIKN